MNESFEKGEIVIVDYSRYGLMNYRKGIVVGITKAGNYKVQIDGTENHAMFNSNGFLRGRGDWDRTSIRKFSESKWNTYLEQEERRTIIGNIKSINFTDLDLEKLRKIQEILDDK